MDLLIKVIIGVWCIVICFGRIVWRLLEVVEFLSVGIEGYIWYFVGIRVIESRFFIGLKFRDIYFFFMVLLF